ncbi:aldo/keto reductase [Pseudonocardia dioxanivorans]|uniref:aldo/keto reductase n=1 Tax=Pseudonocardia dioxanivorans TaxID=240495 RepID=UPI000CD1A9F8|nr:aldo/keto reductase [Pseudonocardia dioxanivorans]
MTDPVLFDDDHAVLGRTGLPVSRFGLGTATFGGQCDEKESHAILDRADELGISFLDTADKYPIGSPWEQAGTTEEIVGRWLRGRRDRFVVATKVHGPTGPRPWDGGLSRRHVLDAVDASLRRLDTDWIDLYQLHRPDPLTPVEETLSALDDVVRAGKVRYVGCSNFLAYQVARALGRSALHGWTAFVSVQARYNLLFREHERELLPLCREDGLGLLAYNALAGGMLTGKHRRDGTSATGTRFADAGAGGLYRNRYWHDDAFDAVEAIRGLAAGAGLTMPVLATAWLRSRAGVTSVILGATRPDQLDLAVEAAGVRLDDALLTELDAITARFRTGDAVQ